MDKKKLITNIGYLSLVQVANIMLPILVVPYVTRVLTTESFGLVNFSQNFITYFSLLISFGFDLTSVQKIVMNKYSSLKLSQIFSNILYAKAILLSISLIIFIILVVFNKRFNKDFILHLASFTICLGAFLTPNYFFQGLADLNIVSIINLSTKVLYTASIFLFIKKSNDYTYYNFLLGLSSIVTGILANYYLLTKYNIFILRPSFFEIWETIKESSIIFLTSLTVNLYTITNTFILGLLQKPEDLAIYTIGIKFDYIVRLMIIGVFSQAYYPMITELFNKNKYEAIKQIKRVFPIIFFITLLVSILQYFVAPIIIPFFFGKIYTKSIIVLQIVSFLPVIISVSNLLAIQLMMNIGMKYDVLKITTSGAFVGLLFTSLLSYKLSYIGTAIGSLFTESIITILCWVRVEKSGISIFNFRVFSKMLKTTL